MPTRKKTPKVIEETPAPLMKPVISEPETLTFKATHFYATLIALAFAVGLLIGYLAWGRTPASSVTAAALAPPSSAVAQQPAATPTLEHVKYNIPTDGFPSLGPADAPITIVEFSDYQCPYCTEWHEQTYQPLLAAYPGKIRFVYRNYPLSFHQNALMGAEAALCAGDQNAYWKYHDKLFSEKAQMNNQQNTTLGVDTYIQWATDIGLDAPIFQTCLSTEKYKKFVQDDESFANSLPTENGQAAVGGTPTFFINGYRLVGAYPLADFQQIIDSQLAASH